MKFFILLLISVYHVTPNDKIIFSNGIQLILVQNSLPIQYKESFTSLSFFYCPNDQCELCIWNSSLIYDVHFYNNSVISYSINPHLSFNSNSLSNSHTNYLLRNYFKSIKFISVSSFLLSLWFILLGYDTYLLPICSFILSVDALVYYLYPRSLLYFYFDPLCRLSLLSLTVTRPWGKETEYTRYQDIVLSYVLEMAGKDLWGVVKRIKGELMMAIISYMFTFKKEFAVYSKLMNVEVLNEVYPVYKKYIYRVICKIVLLSVIIVSMLWIEGKNWNNAVIEVKKSVYGLYMGFIYLGVLAIYHCPLFDIEIKHVLLIKLLEKISELCQKQNLMEKNGKNELKEDKGKRSIKK